MMFEHTTSPERCPDRDKHRWPIGPCEDIAQCPHCLMPTFRLRPLGETYGFHGRDCSLPEVHEGECVGGGSGHEPKHIRGYWKGFEDDVRAEREWWANRDTPDAATS